MYLILQTIKIPQSELVLCPLKQCKKKILESVSFIFIVIYLQILKFTSIDSYNISNAVMYLQYCTCILTCILFVM